jgi:hypothetical protein
VTTGPSTTSLGTCVGLGRNTRWGTGAYGGTEHQAPRGAALGRREGGPWEGARGGRGRRGERAQRAVVRRRTGARGRSGKINFGVPLFERVELQKVE